MVKTFHSQFFDPSEGALQHGAESDIFGQGDRASGEEDYDNDDGLGYYPDGVKRTLTDEQIEIFRHSELHALEREKEKEDERKAFAISTASSAAPPFNNREESATDVDGAKGAEDGEVQGEKQDQAQGTTGNKKKRKRKGKNGKQAKEPKPDLRKRTWDIVETGLDSLDYD